MFHVNKMAAIFRSIKQQFYSYLPQILWDKTVYIPICLVPNTSDTIVMQHFSSKLLNQQQHIRSSM